MPHQKNPAPSTIDIATIALDKDGLYVTCITDRALSKSLAGIHFESVVQARQTLSELAGHTVVLRHEATATALHNSR